VERSGGSGAVAVVAIVVLVIVGLLVLMAFGGLNLFGNRGGGDVDVENNDNPVVAPTLVVPTLPPVDEPAPSSYLSPGLGGAGAA
jgi:hypothetical protein